MYSPGLSMSSQELVKSASTKFERDVIELSLQELRIAKVKGSPASELCDTWEAKRQHEDSRKRD